MKKLLDIISQAPLFNGLSQEQLSQIRQISIDKFYDKGKTVFLESNDCNGFYIVVAGKVKIYKVSFEGKEQILHIYGPGNPFGEVPVFSGQKYPANAETILKSHLLFFPRPAFVDLISEHPSLSLNMLAVLSMRLRQFTVQIEKSFLKRDSCPPGVLSDLSCRRAGNRGFCFPDNFKRTTGQSSGNHSGNPVANFSEDE